MVSWQQTISSLSYDLLNNITHCAIAVPTSYLKDSIIDDDHLAILSGQHLKTVFSEMLNLPSNGIQLYTIGTCLLYGTLAKWSYVANGDVITIDIGSEVSGALKIESHVTDLEGLIKAISSCIHVEALTTSALLRRYADEAGISVLNAGDLCSMYNSHPTAKKVLSAFFDDLRRLLLALIETFPVQTIVLSGQFNYPPNLLTLLQRAAAPTQVMSQNNSGYTAHLGAGLIFHNNYQAVL